MSLFGIYYTVKPHGDEHWAWWKTFNQIDCWAWKIPNWIDRWFSGSLLFFVDLLSLSGLSFSNVRIFFMHRWEIKGIARNFDQFFMTNGLEKLTDILITKSIAINLHQATHPQVCILLLHGSILHTNRIPMSKRAYYMASLTADEWF